MAKWPGGVSQRWERIQTYINSSMESHSDHTTTNSRHTQHQPRTLKDVLARVKLEEVRAVKGKSDHTDTPKPYTPAPAPAAAAAQVAAQNGVDGAGGGGSGVVAGKKGAEEWSEEEQSAFESALRSVPRDAEDRWEQIAALSKKSKSQCVRRYKEIRAQILAGRSRRPSSAGRHRAARPQLQPRHMECTAQ